NEITEEIQEGLLGPMDIVDEDDGRSVSRRQFHEATSPPEGLLDRVGRLRQPDRGCDTVGRFLPLDPGEDREFGSSDVEGIAGSYPRHLADNLAHRPERDALSVRETVAA